jgi:Protein of unknown function (DUF3800)
MLLSFYLFGLNQARVLVVPLALLHAVFDESGKFHDHDVISLCGWIGPLEMWDKFAVRWQAALEETGIDELHTAEFMGLYGQYSHLRAIWGEDWEKKRDEALLRFVNVIRGTVGRGIGATIDTKYYRSMKESFQRAIHKGKDPYFIAFQEVLRGCRWYAEKFATHHNLGNNVRVGLVFDQDEGQSVECLKLFNRIKKEQEEFRRLLSGICFCARKTYEPLQASDFIAHQTKKEMERRNNNPSEPVSRWFTLLSSRNPADVPDGLFNARIFDAEILDELAKRVETGGV